MRGERGISHRRIEQSPPDDLQYTLGGDGKHVSSCDDGGASGAIVRCNGVQLCHSSEEETQSLSLSSKHRAAARRNELDPSGSGENVHQLRSSEYDPAKHKIFLSHSGAQKDFVEQLCVDLEAHGYLFPFFDQRHHSLPESKDFAPLIKHAARLCHVAVIVLSEEFLCSKWPMIELAEFHAAKQGGNHQMRMLPLFYKLEVSDLDDKSIEDRWMPVWNELASRDKRIDVLRWTVAVRACRGVNGLPFGKHSNSEVAYRREIIQSIWKMSCNDLRYDAAREMMGYDRFCKMVSKKFVENNVVGASILGLYGTSGLGKTTLAKALCDYFAEEFEGRVCHVELGTMTRMMRQEWMLKTLCGIEDNVLRRLHDDRKGLKLMRDCMKREPVLLVIDNLTNDESSRREAHEYLTLGFHPRSKVMITARSKEVLEDMVPGMEFCMSIPKLNAEEAGMIFLRSAAPMKCLSLVTDEERRVLRLSVEKCSMGLDGTRCFVLDDDSCVERYPAYHPLALSALGDYFYKLSGNTGMLHWRDSLDHELMKDVFQSPSITSIVHLQFSTFGWSEQLLFLDIALFNRSNQWYKILGAQTFKHWVEWLTLLHEGTTSVVERRLRDLKRSGMIDWVDETGPNFEFKVHSLYEVFAEWYMTDHGMNGLKHTWGVFQPCGTSSDRRGSKCIADLVRLQVLFSRRTHIWILTCRRMREMHNLVVLQLHFCTNLRVLSLAGLDSLRHLELESLSELEIMTLTDGSGTQEEGGIFESLVYVRLDQLDALAHVPDLRSCTSLLFLDVANCPKVTDFEGVECPRVRNMELRIVKAPHQLGRLPDFRPLHYLTDLAISFGGGLDDLFDATDLVSPCKWNRRRRGVQHGEDSDGNSDDFDELSDDGDVDIYIIHQRREKQYVKEGLSILQNVLLYLCEQGRLCTQRGIVSYLSWRFYEGDSEKLGVEDNNGNDRTIVWRFKNAEEHRSKSQLLQREQAF